jgi:predicted GNAT family acetyltransferase
MRCVISEDLPSFAASVLPWLEREPVLYNVLGTLIGQRVRGEVPVEPGCLWTYLLDDGGELCAVAIRIPPHALLVSALPPGGAEVLAGALAGTGLPGVRGPVTGVRPFLAAWGAHATLHGSYRIYRLGELTPPTGVPGRLRPGAPDDVDLATGWGNAFAAEVGDEPPSASTYRDLVESWVRTRELWFWDVDGVPVSMAGSRPPLGGVVRISLVYTPPKQRGNGYAGALVAARSRQLLDAGACACMLYTDLSNPTSNAVYQRIGYRPVMDTQDWVFG